MARPTSISTEQILDAARACFLRDGYAVSTAAIAKEAGISEGSIFKRFSTKAELFAASLGIPEFDIEAEVDARAGAGDLEDQLCELSVHIMDFFREVLPRIILLASSHGPGSHPFNGFRDNPESPPFRLLGALTRLFERERELGRITRGDPEVIARMLMGTLHNYVFFEHIGYHSREARTPEAFARAVVSSLLAGVRPKES